RGSGKPYHPRVSGVRHRAGVHHRVHARTHDAGRAPLGRQSARGSGHDCEACPETDDNRRLITRVLMTFGSVERAMDDIKAGKFVIVADDEDRENEGDLICAAQLVTPEMINFMIRRAGGLICVALTSERVDQLGLAPMSETNVDDYRTAYTVSIDASPRFGVTTGISAQDRATTVRVAVDPATTPGDLRHGGHV